MPSIAILPLAEKDIPAFVQVELAAFRPHPRTPMMWRSGYRPALYAYYETSKTRAFLHDPEARFIKAVDTSTNEIVGVCEMTFALDPERNAARPCPKEDELPPENWPEGGNWAMRQWYKINLWKLLRERFGGKGYILVDILTVSPDRHGQGIGSLLLAYAAEQADERGVLCGLESTPAGLALYNRFGFREERTIKADMRLFGWEEEYDEETAKRVWMVRQPSR